MVRATLGLAAVSFVLMLLVALPGSTNRMCAKELDARRRFADRAALAMVWPPTQLASKITANRRLIVDLLGESRWRIIVAMFVLTNEYSMALQGRDLAAVTCDCRPREPGAPSIGGRTRLGSASAALDRRALLRHLSVAPASRGVHASAVLATRPMVGLVFSSL